MCGPQIYRDIGLRVWLYVSHLLAPDNVSFPDHPPRRCHSDTQSRRISIPENMATPTSHNSGTPCLYFCLAVRWSVFAVLHESTAWPCRPSIRRPIERRTRNAQRTKTECSLEGVDF